MIVVISIVSFFIVIVVLILAHEVGHFITARATGVKVDEFGLGFPPRLLSIKRGETIYSLNAIPLGGFVKMAGEEDPKVPGSLASKSIITRLLVLSAGSLMNFLLPLLLFSIAFMVPHNLVMGQVIVEEVAPNSPAAIAGVRSGDSILSVNGKPVSNSGDVYRYIQSNLGKEVSILIQHSDATTETFKLTPRWRPPEGHGAVGILMFTSEATIIRQHFPFWKAIPMGISSCIETFVLFKNGVVRMIIGAIPLELAGPVGIAQLTGEAAQAGMSPLLEFAAFLSINLAIVNMFPLPALDGGRIAFVFLEWTRRGKRIPPKAEGLVHLIGFGLLMVFFLAITYQDITRIVSGESLIP
ncbi:RIP metalloprotease RseP [Chloroflexota bacterium]